MLHGATKTPLLLMLLCMSSLFSACSKDDQPATDPLDLQGYWLTTTFAADENENGRMDENERQPTDSSDSFLLYFRDKYQGWKRNVDGSDAWYYRWEWLNNYTGLKMHLRTNAGDSSSWVVQIDKLTETELTILDTSDEHRFYWELRKQ